MTETDNMNAFHARIFKRVTDMIIAIEKSPKGVVLAKKFKMTYDQYLNYRNGRTAMGEFEWDNFRQGVYEVDPEYAYKYLREQLFPEY